MAEFKDPPELSPDEVAANELRAMTYAIGRDAEQFFQIGRTKAKRRLANGYVVTIEIKEP
jgi:hypothetical protein